LALGVVLIESKLFGWSGELPCEVTGPDFAEPAAPMAGLGLRIGEVSTPAPNSFLSVNIAPHLAECGCLAFNKLASTDGGLAPAAEALAGWVADPLGCPVALGCQPTPGWKQSPGDATVVGFRTGKVLLFPGLPVL
jgi:hypothetical protein